MKRCTVSFAGIAYGLVITWACLVALSELDWLRDPHKVMQGCHELGKCSFPGYNWLVLYGVVFGPATVAAAINAYAWGRWTLKRWAYRTAWAMSLCIVVYFVAAIGLGR